MESKDKLKEIDIENHACCYFDDIIRGVDINFSNILLDKILYDISYKTSTSPKPFHIRFDKINGFIRVRGGEFRHLVLFDYILFDKVCDKIKYLISEKLILQIVLIKILAKSELIQITLYLLKKY